MTIEEIRISGKTALTVYDVGTLLGCDPATLRMTAKMNPERVKFPFVFSGNRMKIPRETFIKWYEGSK